MAWFLLFIQGSPGTLFLPVVNSPALKHIHFVELCFLSRNRLPTNIGSTPLTLCTLFQIFVATRRLVRSAPQVTMEHEDYAIIAEGFYIVYEAV